MKKAQYMAATLVLVSLLVTGPSAGADDWITNPSNGHVYKAINCGWWHDCETAAVAECAHLVTINDQAEQTWLINAFGTSQNYWIGFTDESQEGDWDWISGEETTYTNWAPGEPNNGQSCGEHWAVMNWGQYSSNGSWNDLGTCLPAEYSGLAIIEKSTGAQCHPEVSITKSGTGSGTVTSDPPGIDCGITCTAQSASFDAGTSITLTATPESGSVFSGWSGGGCSGTGDCVLTMTADTTVTATFLLVYDLVIEGSGTGSGTVAGDGISCSINNGVAGGDCTEAIAESIPFTLTATPDPGSVFKGWTGGGCPATGPCKLTLTGDTTVTATFIDASTFTKVTMISPNGRERLPSGGQWTLIWGGPPEITSYKLFYSLNNGHTWKPVTAESITGTTSFLWNPVPTVKKNITTCLTKVVEYDGSEIKVGEDRSDSPFTIGVVRLDTPNGGETFSWGNQETIRWTMSETKNEVAKVQLRFTKNGGVTWKPIATLEGNPGSYDWDVPCTWNETKPKCKVKATLTDSSGKNLGQDTSDNYFTLVPGCTDVSGNWSFSDKGTATCWWSDGYSDTESIRESGTIGISQDDCSTKWSDSNLDELRSGSVCGNSARVSGTMCVALTGGVVFTSNWYGAKGTVIGDEIVMHGSGYCAGSVEGMNFSCTSNDTVILTRPGVLATDEKEVIRQPAPLFMNNSLRIVPAISP